MSVEEGVAATGVEVVGVFLALLPRVWRRVELGSGVAKRPVEFGAVGGGGGVAYEAEDLRPRLLRRVEAPPSEENVFSTGLENESSGEDGPAN